MEWQDPTSEERTAAGQSSCSGASANAIRCTFGTGETQTAPWTDVREIDWQDLAILLTTHRIGPKDGVCIVPATFRGTKRQKKDAARIDVAMLDSDRGATLEEIISAIRARGWAAIVSSTWSHLTTTAKISRKPFDKWLLASGRSEGEPASAEAFLLHRGMRPAIAAGAQQTGSDENWVYFRHGRCPKFRVALPLARSWKAADYDAQAAANAAWKERIEALAAALSLEHDESCTDTSRLFFLPRHPADGPPAETRILDGLTCDLFALPSAQPAGAAARKKGGKQKASTGPCDFDLPPRMEFIDPKTGQCFDLTTWATISAQHFKIVEALRARSPGAFVGRIADGLRHHITCPNAEAHTDPSPDAATFVCDPGSSGEAKGFVIHCRHAHCDGRDRLLFLKQMLEQRTLLLEDLENPAFQPTAPPPRPVIKVTGGNLPEVVRLAEQALIGPPHEVYQRGSFLVRPGLIRLGVGDADARNSLQIIPLEDHALAEAMTACASFQQYDARGKKWLVIDAPMKVAAVLRQRRGLWRFPVLAGLLGAPSLRPDGSILDQPGYDSATGLLLSPRAMVFPNIPDRPSKDDAHAALVRLDALIATFPFVDAASRSVALSGLLTAAVRRSLRTAPLHGYTAPVAGSGKSMLVDLCSIISTGRAASVIAQGRTEEELEKRLGALLLGGEHVIAIDNCEAPLGGEFLCSLITQEFVRCRILGKSEAPELPGNSFVTATGNNLTLLGDMTRRAILCQLDPQVERPELRTFDNDPLKEAHQHRAELLVAALTVLRAYHVAGYPDAPAPLGSFESWSTWVRGSLLWLDQADPVDTMETVRALDPKIESIAAVLSEWRPHLAGREVTVREIIDFACTPRTALGGSIYAPKIEFAHADFREALLAVAGDKGAINGKRLGRWIGQHEKKRVEGLRITRARILNGTQLWKLEEG